MKGRRKFPAILVQNFSKKQAKIWNFLLTIYHL